MLRGLRRVLRWVVMSMIFVCASIGVLAVIMVVTTSPEERGSYSATREADTIARNATGTTQALTITMTPTVTNTPTIAPSATSDLSSEVIMSEATKSTDNPFEDIYYSVESVETIVEQRAVLDEFDQWTIYAEVVVSDGYDNEDTANRLLAIAQLTGLPIASAIFVVDDRNTATDYSVRAGDDTWTTAVRKFNLPSESVDTPQAQVIVTDTPEPVRVVATAAPVDTQIPRPRNCKTAVAMGLTAQQAAQWANLDRDKDGVACYGD